MKLPTTIGGTIDLLYKLREERKVIEAKAAAVKEQESALEKHLMNNFERGELQGARGKLASASVRHSTVADVTDWDKVYSYIHRNKAWDMLQKRISVTACRARWDEKKNIPGIEPQEITTLSLTKV